MKRKHFAGTIIITKPCLASSGIKYLKETKRAAFRNTFYMLHTSLYTVGRRSRPGRSVGACAAQQEATTASRRLWPSVVTPARLQGVRPHHRPVRATPSESKGCHSWRHQTQSNFVLHCYTSVTPASSRGSSVHAFVSKCKTIHKVLWSLHHFNKFQCKLQCRPSHK